ncbi:MAG: hypothetical protein JST47_08385 [Bacteroidetes bacterium]|nr:hypothetical protein [Bacteroidota bacterium]MBS1975008.1 hypothetical protein [Bacteroidota bacterium]
MEWLNASISPLKDLIAYLGKQSRISDVQKKQVVMELRNNLNVFRNGFMNSTPYDNMIDLLSNEAIQQAIKNNFSFKKLKKGHIKASNVFDERNKKYIGWTAEKLVDKIDEKIVELKNIRKMSNSVKNAKNNIPLMMSNLYFRMKLLADFIRAGQGID